MKGFNDIEKKSEAENEPYRRKFCSRGHLKIRQECGRYSCPTCSRERSRRSYEKQRQKRLDTRRARIAARRSPPGDECIWAAGHFEGEGTVTIMSGAKTNLYRPAVSVTSTDSSVINFFQLRWPGYVSRTVREKEGKRYRDAFTWRLSAHDKIESFLLDMLPHLKTMRVREKAALLIDDIRDRVQMRRTPEERRRKAERMARMRALNKRGPISTNR